ncbi:MAG: cysteine desulfurase [Candidatus Doudnabacteria bacterium]|nr:cysteine desulfurase [Candidatus Doudnabacteria bacterium]
MAPSIIRSTKLIYLDHAAATPVRAEVLRAMQPFWRQEFGNPSTLYSLGQHAHDALSRARTMVAGVLEADPAEIIFTAGGSESDTLAILGAARAFRMSNKRGGHIITSATEHHAVLGAVKAAEELGISVSLLPVDPQGFVSIHAIIAAVQADTFLVSIMLANNEVGTIQPIAQISQALKKLRPQRQKNKQPTILLHTDACQAAGYITLSVSSLGVDLLTLNGSKIYGPKQTGVLYVRKGTPLTPLIYGGGQEYGLRSGTENVPGAIGFARALKLAHEERHQEVRRISKLRNWFAEQLTKSISNCHIHGPSLITAGVNLLRLPNNLNVSFDNCDGEALVLYLDALHIAVATGSACATGSTEPSHVLRAMQVPPFHIRGSLRFTLGRETTKTDLIYVCRALRSVVTQQRHTSTML